MLAEGGAGEGGAGGKGGAQNERPEQQDASLSLTLALTSKSVAPAGAQRAGPADLEAGGTAAAAEATAAAATASAAALHSVDSGKRGGGLTFVQALLISLNFNLGFAVLLFPYMLATAGWTGYVMLALGCFVTLFTAKFLAVMMVRMPAIETFSDIGLYAARKASGGSRRVERVAMASFALFQTLELFGYLLFGVVSVQGALVLLIPGMTRTVAFVLTAGAFALMVLPTLSPRALSYAGSVGVAAFFLTLGVLMASGVERLAREAQRAAAHAAAHVDDMPFANAELRHVFGMYGGILLLFSGHAVYPSIFNDLADRNDCDRVVNWTFAGMMVFCVLPSLLAVLAFGPAVIAATDLPTGYLPAGTLANSLGQVFLIIKMTSAAGVQMYPIIIEGARFVQAVIVGRRRGARSSSTGSGQGGATETRPEPSESQAAAERRPSATVHLGVGMLVVALAMLMGHVLKTVHFIMSLNGALFAVALCLTLPSICFLVLVPRKDEPYKVPLAWLLFGLGIVSCGLVLYSLF
jgi:hypothetical protein